MTNYETINKLIQPSILIAYVERVKNELLKMYNYCDKKCINMYMESFLDKLKANSICKKVILSTIDDFFNDDMTLKYQTKGEEK